MRRWQVRENRFSGAQRNSCGPLRERGGVSCISCCEWNWAVCVISCCRCICSIYIVLCSPYRFKSRTTNSGWLSDGSSVNCTPVEPPPRATGIQLWIPLSSPWIIVLLSAPVMICQVVTGASLGFVKRMCSAFWACLVKFPTSLFLDCCQREECRMLSTVTCVTNFKLHHQSMIVCYYLFTIFFVAVTADISEMFFFTVFVVEVLSNRVKRTIITTATVQGSSESSLNHQSCWAWSFSWTHDLTSP